ncbi:MAG: SulP family inorganic anion transporter, partial [Coriobacteriia bacterium]|nr:SulP family inorganic anion transporter [Coriobacteriia bacterium]
AVLLIGITAKYGFAGLQIVTLMAGVMLVAFGLAKLGSVIRFIPESVILGFTAGIAVVIWVGQWANFFGLPRVDGELFLDRLVGLVSALPQLHPATAVLGVVSVIVIAAWPRVPVLSVVPGPLVALVAGAVYVAVAHPAGVATIGSAFGGIPRGLPPLTLPRVSMATVMQLVQPAFAIALLGAIESLLSATVADGMTGTRHDSNQELIGQGAANVAVAFFGGFAATGAIARTATNVRHGGNSPVAGLAHAATVLLVLVALAPLAVSVPLATLAAILFVVAFNMSDIGRVVRTVRRAPRSDVAVMLVTLLLTVFADLVIAVEVGVILSMLNFFRRMTAAVTVRTVEEDELALHVPGEELPEVPEGVLVYTIDGPFFFGAVEQFESALLHTGTDPEGVVLSLARVPFIDLSGLAALREAVERLEKRGVRVVLCGADAAVSAALVRAAISGTEDLPASIELGEALARLGGTAVAATRE